MLIVYGIKFQLDSDLRETLDSIRDRFEFSESSQDRDDENYRLASAASKIHTDLGWAVMQDVRTGTDLCQPLLIEGLAIKNVDIFAK